MNSLISDPSSVFLNISDYDLHLKSGSPAVDKGKNASIDHDYEGDYRPFGNGFDIGADEKTD